jgi:hypothetical protein
MPPLIPVDGVVVAGAVVVSVDVWAIAAVPRLSENAVMANILVIMVILLGLLLLGAASGPNPSGRHVFQNIRRKIGSSGDRTIDGAWSRREHSREVAVLKRSRGSVYMSAALSLARPDFAGRA